ncbi:MAG: helix-turn-helix domain-containing protein [Synergistaceae bacterium]|jgi:transcriptional regulator with XRE-family HTH domain|nr:helix-turn-helix domain-containing protein [Synergistaceae bacterium]
MTKLQEARKDRGLKAIDLCCATKLHPATISAIENRRQVPGRETRAKLCRFFKVSH